MGTMLRKKSNEKRSGLNFFLKMVWLLSALLFVGNVNAQNQISLSVTPGEWVGSVSPTTLIDGGSVTVTLQQYQCQLGNLSIRVNGINYQVVPFGNIQFSTTNGRTLSSTSGGSGVLNIGSDASFCDWQTTGFSFTVYLDFTGEEVYYSAESSFPPKISVTSSLNPFRTCPDRASASQTFEVSGRDLTDNIEVRPLAGYEYSTNNTTFQPSLSITPVAGRVQQTVYVRLTAGNADGSNPGGNIECSTVGTASKFVAVSGSVENIAGIRVTGAPIPAFIYREGNNPSEAVSFIVSACSAGEITVNAPANFEVSKDGATSGFSGSATLSSTGGTVWVRLNAANRGFYEGNITITDGVDTENVFVSGTVEMYDCVNHPYTLVLDRIRGTICALDECNAIFQLNMTTTDAYYSDFGIRRAGSNNLIQLNRGSILPNNVRINDEGEKLRFDHAGLNSFTLYADMRNPNSIIFTTSRPILDETNPFVNIKGKTLLVKCEDLLLEAVVCPNNSVSSYRWYQGNNLIEGESGATLNVIKVKENTIYQVEALNAVGEVLGSSTISVLIASGDPLPRPTITSASSSLVRLNQLEHQINQGNNFLINLELPVNLNSLDNYVLQGRSLHVGSTWVDLGVVQVQGDDISAPFTANEGMLYRFKAFDNDECSIDHFSSEVLVRVIFECISENPADTLFYDDFGYFTLNGTTPTYHYTDENGAQTLTTQVRSWSYPLLGSTFWAPDPSVSDQNMWRGVTPDGHVRRHRYAIFDPNAPYTWDGCNRNDGYRIEDQHYAIVTNPKSGDCGNNDYWDGTDHTGNLNGGMLFINCADEPNTVLYSRKIKIEDACKGVKVLFSAWISNATIKGSTPVNIRLDIWNKDRTNLIYSISSGDVLVRRQTDLHKWANLSFKFDVMDETEYILELTNNYPGGVNAGNDLLLDDILVTVCYPSVKMLVDGERELTISTCSATESYKLCATPDPVLINGELVNVNLEEYIPTPHYAFKYTDSQGKSGLLEHANGETISTDSCIPIRLADFPHGKMEIVLLVASTPELINKIVADPTMESCKNNVDFFIRDTIWITYKPFEPTDIDTVVCPETPVPLPNLIGVDNMKKWDLYKLGSNIPEMSMSNNDDIFAGMTDTLKISAILMDSLAAKYQRYMSDSKNVPLNGEPREFNFTFETFLGCVYDGSSEPSIMIKLSKLPRMTNITAEVGGKSIMIAGNELQTDTVRVCSDGSKVINVQGDMTAEPDYQWEWVWELKETGVELSRNNGSYELTKGGNIPNEGILLVRTSFKHECTDTLEIPFKFFDPFEVTLAISTDNIGKGKELCLFSESETGEEVTLTANIKPEDRKPAPMYYWYESFNGSPFVEMAGNPTSETMKKKLIGKDENGKYAYKVVAVDDICFTSYGPTVEGENVGENFFNAYKPIEIIKIESITDTVCVGNELVFTATIANPRAGITYKWTSTHDGTPKTGSFATTEETTEIKFTIGAVLGDGQVELSIEDDLCGDLSKIKKYYTFILVAGKEIKIQQANPVCLDLGKKTGEATISLEAPVAGAIKYEWYDGSNNLIATTTSTVTSQKVPLVSGSNTFYVKAIGECDDLRSQNVTIQANEHFKTVFKASLSGDEISNGGYLCLEGSNGEATTKEVTLTATLLTPEDGATRTYYWYKWQDGAAPVKIDETTSNTNTSSTKDNITDGGSYKYMVEVADGGICYSPGGAGIDVSKHDNADTTIFIARKPLSVDFSLSNLYCEDGREETIKAIVTGYTDPNDLKDIIYTWEVNGTEVQSTSSAEYALTIKAGDKVQVSINDIVCGRDRSSAVKTVSARNPLTLGLSADIKINDICALDSPRVCFSVNPSVSQEWSYHWEILNEKEEVIKQNNTSDRQNCILMPLGRSGIVRVSAYDELCDANSNYATMPYHIRDEISIQLLVRDIDGFLMSEGWLCEDSVILEARVIAGGTTGGYTWTWFDNGTEVKTEQNQPTPRRIKLTPELWKYTVTATKDGACGDQDSQTLGTNLIMPIQPTITIKGKDGDRFCSTDESIKLEVSVDDGLDLSKINFEWWSVNGGWVTYDGASATYQLPYDFTHSLEVSVGVRATYEGDRGNSICSRNTAYLDLTIQNPIEIKMRENKKGEYDICLDDPYREITLIVDIFDGRPDSLYWYRNGLLDTISVVNGQDSIVRVVRVSNTEKFSILAKDEVCGDVKDESGVEISVTRMPDFKLTIEPDVIEITQNTRLTAIINDSIKVADSTYIWTNDIGWKKETLEFQTNSGYMAQEGIYTFTVSTKFGNCYLESNPADLEVLELINNIITPYNKNGKNDVFMGPKGRRPGYKVEIFNRYQQKIFEGDNGWDGTYRGRLAEPGTYYYRIEMKSGRVMRGTVEVAKF